VVLLVVDEAHRAKGKHAFATVTQAIRQENPYLRVLGKT
jgi:ERCC4-related helicase